VYRQHHAVSSLRQEGERLLFEADLGIEEMGPYPGESEIFSPWYNEFIFWLCVAFLRYLLPLKERGCRDDAPVLQKKLLPKARISHTL